tara:strand:+ start:3543 stop:4892 length:1350 start_codon:yes stop_codon:yes gene_type:complete
MASKTTLNAKNLAALGADRLADLLLEVTKGNAGAKRRLRLELASEVGSGDDAREIRKRLITIARSQSFIDWQGRNAFAADLDMQRRAITLQVGPVDPVAAFDLSWRFVALANGVYERCDDSTGRVQSVFHEACEDLIDLAEVAEPDPLALADQLLAALTNDDYGHYQALISGLAPILGSAGLLHLKAGIAASKFDLSDNYALRIALEQIADAEGDADAYIAQQSELARKAPQVAAEIARRLFEAGRLEEAWEAINAPDQNDRGWIPYDWEVTRIRVMQAIGQADAARDFMWECFARSLNSGHLRAWLSGLPDFEDVEAETRAMEHALGFESFTTALHFLMTWPALERAGALITNRAAEIDGHHYELLGPASEALEDRYPLAATLLKRGLIDFALENSRVKRYRHAARHLRECKNLAARIDAFTPFETHETYVEELRQAHGKKRSFWGAE